jgi:SAM-dependent methyltransferase
MSKIIKTPMEILTDSIACELKFWKRFVKTERFLHDWLDPHNKTSEMIYSVYEFIKDEDGLILDVGSGVSSLLRGSVKNPNQITTVDPLGKLYEIIFDYDKYNIKPPLPYSAEGINLHFDLKFDIVHCSNALDHTQDPYEALKSMAMVCNKGGYIIIQGFENEAIYENWEGFHKWNIQLTPYGNLFIEDRDGEYPDVTAQELGCELIQSTKLKLKDGKPWFIWILRKM